MVGSLARELKSPDTPVEVAAAKRQPTLLVSVPEGAELQVDGRKVPLGRDGPTTVRVTPGQPTKLLVQLEGFAPFETETTLEHNEQLMLRVDLETLKEK